jgi:hypothetical protein
VHANPLFDSDTTVPLQGGFARPGPRLLSSVLLRHGAGACIERAWGSVWSLPKFVALRSQQPRGARRLHLLVCLAGIGSDVGCEVDSAIAAAAGWAVEAAACSNPVSPRYILQPIVGQVLAAACMVQHMLRSGVCRGVQWRRSCATGLAMLHIQ